MMGLLDALNLVEQDQVLELRFCAEAFFFNLVHNGISMDLETVVEE
jgi:hypothetical protein